MRPTFTPALYILYLSIEVALERIIGRFDLGKTAIANGITDLPELYRSCFVKDYTQIIEVVEFHNPFEGTGIVPLHPRPETP
jgi:hypothetical protein